MTPKLTLIRRTTIAPTVVGLAAAEAARPSSRSSPRARLLAGSVVAVAAGVLSSAVGVAAVRPRRVLVSGTSMVPALVPGDRLLVARTHRPRPGDLVAVRDPRQPRRLLVKRVASVTSAGVDVRGDDPAHSTDSRSFGPVPEDFVVGIVLHRYGPPGRPGLGLSHQHRPGGAVPSM